MCIYIYIYIQVYEPRHDDSVASELGALARRLPWHCAIHTYIYIYIHIHTYIHNVINMLIHICSFNNF